MITAFFLVFFFDNSTIFVHTDQQIFKTMEDCELFAETEKQRNQDLAKEGINRPHKAIHVCYDWGQDV